MSATVLHSQRGRVLVVGREQACAEVVARLSGEGYACAVARGITDLPGAAQQLKPEAILLTSSPARPAELLQVIRQNGELSEVPVLGDLTRPEGQGLLALGLDDFVRSFDELPARLEAAFKARRLAEKEALARLRMEALLEITQAATSSLELDRILSIAVQKVSRVLSTDRTSIVLVEGGGPRTATVVASDELMGGGSKRLDLIKYPELRHSLQTRQPLYIEDASVDPLLDEVRSEITSLGLKSILVQPLVSGDDMLGALLLTVRRSGGTIGREEREFAQAAAGALANSVRNAQLHAALKRKRDDLESAYVDRYRELSLANRRLKELNRVKDDMIAVLSHDLRAPLQVLLGHGRILLDGRLTSEQRMSGEAIVRQGRKILGMVESLLEQGKGEQARVALEPTMLDLSELCKEAVSDLVLLAENKKIKLRAETPESLSVLGDEIKLREVLQNLVTNAIQHASSTVKVYSQRLKRPDGDVVKVAVQDDGAGLSPEQIHLVFDRYRHGPGGIGLGLSICKDFVEMHGGEIWAETPKQGGCIFVFTIPMAQVAEQQAPLPPSLLESTGQPRVLVVEDEPEVAAILSEILRSRYRVEVARDGAEGLAKAKALYPDLIVMDVFLPKLDGLDAVMALKASSDTASIPVILLSAHRGVAEKVRALNLGAVDYMSKPFQALELLSRTDRALKLRHAEKELARSQTLLRKTGSDPETGLFDRAGLIQRLEQEISRSFRYGRPLCFVLLRPQSAVGDKVRACASFLRASLRLPDVVGHLGEGIFGVILPESSPESAGQVFSRLLPELAKAGGLEYGLSATQVQEPEGGAEAFLERLLSEER